jgi:hypothetical protein
LNLSEVHHRPRSETHPPPHLENLALNSSEVGHRSLFRELSPPLLETHPPMRFENHPPPHLENLALNSSELGHRSPFREFSPPLSEVHPPMRFESHPSPHFQIHPRSALEIWQPPVSVT